MLDEGLKDMPATSVTVVVSVRVFTCFVQVGVALLETVDNRVSVCKTCVSEAVNVFAKDCENVRDVVNESVFIDVMVRDAEKLSMSD
jgi:hypothetical protein